MGTRQDSVSDVNGQSAAEFSEIEYQEVGNNFRSYTTFLIQIASIFVALNVVLFAGLAFVTTRPSPPGLSVPMIPLIGIVSSLAAIAIQFRIYRYWRGLIQRGAELDELRGFRLYKGIVETGHRLRVFRSNTVVLVCYTVILIFWFVSLMSLLQVGTLSVTINLRP